MDCITWSPAGRILQVEYAMEAVKQGTPVLGLRSKECVVLVSFKRAQSELASHQQKIFKIDDNMAIGISGLTADARVLADYMRNECLNHRYVFDSAMNVGRLVAQVADKSQQKTQNSSKRPYGARCPVVVFRCLMLRCFWSQESLDSFCLGRTPRGWLRREGPAPLRDLSQRKLLRALRRSNSQPC